MNTLLVIPRMIEKDGEPYFFPLGIPYISSVLKENGFSVVCLNMNHVKYRDMFGTLMSFILGNNIDVVATGGFSFYASAIKFVIDAVTKSTESKKKIVTIVGGAVITTEPILMSSYFGCDFGVIGEGEETAVELWGRLAKDIDSDCADIPGLARKKDGRYVLTSARHTYLDIEKLPFPDYESFGMKEYLDSSGYGVSDTLFTAVDNPRSIAVMGSRSCPYKCTFCYHSVGDRFRMRSVGSIIAEIESYIDRFGVNCVAFHDDILFTDEQRMEALCTELQRLKLKFFLQLRVSAVNERVLQRLKEAGCVCVSYGLESHSERVLTSMKKHISLDDMDRALELTYNAGLDIQGNFIFGDPAESMDTVLETMRWVADHRKYLINIALIATLPGSEIYQYAKKIGCITDPLDFILRKNYVVNLTSMSDDEYSTFRQIITGANTNANIYARFVVRDVVAYCRGRHGWTSLNVGSRKCYMVSRCPHCGEKNEHANIRPDFLFCSGRSDVIIIHCKHCLRRYYAQYLP